jgi:glycosyltransferase involved in cell wall biosynthesis
MRIAVFHSSLNNIGGAEVVALITARELNADLYTANLDKDKIIKMGFKDLLPRITSIGAAPVISPFKQQTLLWMFQTFKLPKVYDVHLILDDWSISIANHHSPCLWYIHAPFNELWEYKDFIKQKMLSWWQKPLFELWVQINRSLTKKYTCKVERVVCNSRNSQARAKKYLCLEAPVIHPPVDTSKYAFRNTGDYWLSVNRLTRAKRIELQIEAFRSLPDEKLLIVGSYEKGAGQFEDYFAELKQDLPPNVTILHWIDQLELINLYSECKGFIATAFDEDFGLTVIEAMASGKPVIAPDSGGYRESVIDGKTGVLLKNFNSLTLTEAVSSLSQKLMYSPAIFKSECRKRAEVFDTKVFIGKISEEISFIQERR